MSLETSWDLDMLKTECLESTRNSNFFVGLKVEYV